MSTPAIPAVWPQSLGINADVVDIPTNTPSGQGVPSFNGVFPPLTAVDPAAGGYFIEREWMNALFKLLGENVWFQQHGAIYPWSDTLDYPVNAHVLGSDGREYRAIQQSGPGLTEGAQDPTSQGGAAYWVSLEAAIAHAAMPNWNAFIEYSSLSQGDGWRTLPTPAPADGYLLVHAVLSATSQTSAVGLRVNGSPVPIYNYDATNKAMNFAATIPVNAGDTFEIYFKVNKTPESTDACYIVFFYANGTTPTI